MKITQRLRASFGGLRGKLILGYTLTTALALLALELVVLGGAFLAYLINNDDVIHYLSDVQGTLVTQARGILTREIGEEGKRFTEVLEPPNLGDLQVWVNSVYAYGFASEPPITPMDSPAAIIDKTYGLYVLDRDGKILAASPGEAAGKPGKVYESPVEDFVSTLIHDAAMGKVSDWKYARLPNRSYLLALPVWVHPAPQETDRTVTGNAEVAKLAGVIIVAVEPPPPFYTLLPTLLAGLTVIILTGLGLVAAAAPFGALFGFIMSGGLTRRLANLSQAADAWSKGDFSVQPHDTSRDEIGLLGLRLRHMAERIQNLLESRDELALLQERNRLARDLHDTVKQQTFAAVMQLRAARNQVESDPAAAHQAIEAAETLLKTAQHDLATIITELRPAALETQGLAAALADFLPQWSQNASIQAELHVQGERPLPLEKEQTLFRLVQEGLSNVARHSKATRVDVYLEYNDAQVSLQIKDNGQGFDLAAPQNTGFGLQSMRQRARTLNGEIFVNSSPGLGTRILVVIPLENGEKSDE